MLKFMDCVGCGHKTTHALSSITRNVDIDGEVELYSCVVCTFKRYVPVVKPVLSSGIYAPPEPQAHLGPICSCGGKAANTTHSAWCESYLK